MANDILKGKVIKCMKDLEILYSIISQSNENKEKYKKVRFSVGLIIAFLLQSKGQEEIQELCDRLKKEALEYNDSGDNLGIKQSASDFATKVAMTKPENYDEFIVLLISEDKQQAIDFFISDELLEDSQPTKSEVKIENVEFADFDDKGNTRKDFGAKLFSDVQYLKPKITYRVLHVGEPITVWYKIYSPSGQLSEVPNDPSVKVGFTWRGTLLCKNERVCTAIIVGFGNDECNYYNETSTWRIEFYDGDTCLYRSKLTPKPTSKPTPKTPTKSSSSNKDS
jgi:hypothetical protein